MANPRQTHRLQVNIGSIKPSGGRARSLLTPPSKAPAPRTADNHNPARGAAATGPRQLGNQGAQGSSLQGSKPKPATGPNVKPVEGSTRRGGSTGYAGGQRPQNLDRRAGKRPA